MSSLLPLSPCDTILAMRRKQTTAGDPGKAPTSCYASSSFSPPRPSLLAGDRRGAEQQHLQPQETVREEAQQGRRAESRKEPALGDITLTLDRCIGRTAATIGLSSWNLFLWIGAKHSGGWKSVHAGP